MVASAPTGFYVRVFCAFTAISCPVFFSAGETAEVVVRTPPGKAARQTGESFAARYTCTNGNLLGPDLCSLRNPTLFGGILRSKIFSPIVQQQREKLSKV